MCVNLCDHSRYNCQKNSYNESSIYTYTLPRGRTEKSAKKIDNRWIFLIGSGMAYALFTTSSNVIQIFPISSSAVKIIKS